jgi:hypothetical protein
MNYRIKIGDYKSAHEVLDINTNKMRLKMLELQLVITKTMWHSWHDNKSYITLLNEYEQV